MIFDLAPVLSTASAIPLESLDPVGIPISAGFLVALGFVCLHGKVGLGLSPSVTLVCSGSHLDRKRVARNGMRTRLVRLVLSRREQR